MTIPYKPTMTPVECPFTAAHAHSQRHFSQGPIESKERDPLVEDTVLLANLEEENAESPSIPT